MSDSDLIAFDRASGRLIAADVRRGLATPLTTPIHPPIVHNEPRHSEKRRWMQFRNDSGQTVPAFGCMAVTSAVELSDLIYGSANSEEPILTCTKPSETPRRLHVINGGREVAKNGFGECIVSGYTDVLVSGVVSVGMSLGPVPNSWQMAAGYPSAASVVSATRLGEATVELQQITRLLAKTTAASTMGSSMPVWCDICQSLIPHAPAAISAGVYRVQAVNLFGSLPTNTLVWLEEVNSVWYIVAPAGSAGTPFIRFELRGELEPGLSAPAAVLIWDADLDIYTPVLDDEDEEIIIRVADFTDPGTWRGKARVEGGPGGFEGWCVPVSDRPYAGFEDDEGEPAVTETSALYEIIWMEQLAEWIDFVLYENLHNSQEKAEVIVQRWGKGINPTDDALEIPIEVWNPPHTRLGAGKYFWESLTGYYGHAVYKPEDGKYWIRFLDMCTPSPVPAPEE